MKKFTSIMAVLAMLMLPFNNSNAKTTGSVTGFWLDVSALSDIASSGATTVKIYAAVDADGSFCYIMVGADAQFNTLPGQNVIKQNNKGVCPPSCEFTSMSLEGGSEQTSVSEAQGNINSYMERYSGVKNCARFTFTALSGLMSSSTYIKVNIGTGASAAGLKADGSSSGKANALGTAVTSGL